MSMMHRPAHPGSILREDVLPELNVTVTQAAQQLGVSRVTLSRLINEKAGISAEMAVRLGLWLGNGPEIWLRMQMQYDLWKVLKHTPKVSKADWNANDERFALAA